MRRSTIRTSIATLAASTVLLTAGCGVKADDEAVSTRQGSGAGVGGPAEAPSFGPAEGSFEGTGGAIYLRQAADATAEVSTQKIAMEMSMDGIPGMGAVSITSEGAFDLDANRGHMTMDMSDVFSAAGGDGLLPDDAGLMEMVIDGDDVYMRSELLTMFGDSDKPWVRSDREDVGEAGALGGGAQSDPTAFLDFLQGASDDVTEVGVEDVRGVEATHYSATLDLERLVEESSGAEQEELESQLDGLSASGDGLRSVPTDAWVDEDGHVRKIVMAMEVSGIDADVSLDDDPTDGASSDDSSDPTATVSMDLTVEFYDFGEPVDVEIPPASQVGELDRSPLSDD